MKRQFSRIGVNLLAGEIRIENCKCLIRCYRLDTSLSL